MEAGGAGVRRDRREGGGLMEGVYGGKLRRR